MTNRQQYIMKFRSSRLKEFGYNIELSFEQAKANGEVIALSDNQMLRSIREIHSRNIDYIALEELYVRRDKIKKKKNSKENLAEISHVQNCINNILYIPEYITIVMDHPSHYKYLFKNGLMLNNKKYIRLSCSAGQARVSTVVFCEEDTANKLNVILDNGRDMNKKLTPSKYNAYKGLAGSATKIVSTPRFCVVPDYVSKTKTKVKVNYVTETPLDEDDHIEIREIKQEFNRFDGQGLISYEMATKWSNELGLDYVPAQWCVRQNFLKGMLCTFDIHGFCETENNKNYIIKSIYKDENGNNKIVNLQNVDVIISESQFKLWDSFDSVEVYQENCIKNNLSWGVSIHSPKQDSHILKMNYQFLQTLKFNKSDIEKICTQFVDWINGISSDNIYFTLLFLLGKENDEEKINDYIKNSENYWIKSLIVNHNLIKDKYIKKKIYELIKKRIKSGCLGEILVDGNFQTIVSDPYAMMQHVCGQEVTGLLGKREYYSKYWNNKDVDIVDSMRAPLTFRSEHLKLPLVNNERLRYWYRYCYTGIIINVHGHETLNWAGSDFDYDILATTSNPIIIKGIYENELPVVYDPPKPQKIIFTDEDLYNADLFAFGSAIGSITNKSTSGYALLSLFEQDSEEYNVTMNRLKMCTKLQSAQIDKAKIGRNVKGIPNSWINKQSSENEGNKKHVDFLNSIMLDKHPYFFTYLYPKTKKQYKSYINDYDMKSRYNFGLGLEDLINKKRKTAQQREFLHEYADNLPVIDSDCVMNNLCKYIESIDFDIRNKIKVADNDETHKLYISEEYKENESLYESIIDIIEKFNKGKSDLGRTGLNSKNNSFKHNVETLKSSEMLFDILRDELEKLCSNTDYLIYHLIKLFYVKSVGLNKDLLWGTYGKNLFMNVLKNTKETVFFPIPDSQGEIIYLNQKFTLGEVTL